MVNRKEFFDPLKSRLSPYELKLIHNAYWFAKDVHRAQKRDSGERYFEHCRRVALILIAERRFFNAAMIATALIHDAIEDTAAPPDAVLALFGPTIYEWAQMLSKTVPGFDPISGAVLVRGKKDPQKYFWAIENAPREVRLVKCADRTDNLRSFGCWPPERKDKYIRETNDYILPIAQATDLWFVWEFSKYCATA